MWYDLRGRHDSRVLIDLRCVVNTLERRRPNSLGKMAIPPGVFLIEYCFPHTVACWFICVWHLVRFGRSDAFLEGDSPLPAGQLKNRCSYEICWDLTRWESHWPSVSSITTRKSLWDFGTIRQRKPHSTSTFQAWWMPLLGVGLRFRPHVALVSWSKYMESGIVIMASGKDAKNWL